MIIFPKRKDEFLAVYSAGALVLYNSPFSERIVLNQSAALIWQLADGTRNTSDLYQDILKVLPAELSVTEEEIEEGLNDLLEKEVIIFKVKAQAALPIVRVGFSNFWEGFEGKNNFFLEAIQPYFTILLVPPQAGELDILFFGEFHSEGFHHNRVNRDNTLKIGCFSDPLSLNEMDFDFAYCTFPVEENGALSISAASIYMDWAALKANEDHLPAQHVEHLFKYGPLLAGQELMTYLNSEAFAKEDALSKNKKIASQKEKRLLKLGEVPLKKGQLTIGMATYDDYDGVYFSIQSLRLFHPEVMDRVSFIIVDNNPEGSHGKALQKLSKDLKNCLYLSFTEFESTAVRDVVFREAESEYVLCMDSHVLIKPGGLRRLIDFLDSNPDCMDIVQGPLIYDDLEHFSTSFSPVWQGGMFGVWHTDPRGKDDDASPFEISMQGLGLFACRKKAWLGFNPRMRGFGGEEGYLHEKFRRAGHKALCLPGLKWLHRFGRPSGVNYPNKWEDRIRNYTLLFDELDMDTAPVQAHFKALLGEENFHTTHVKALEKLQHPFLYFDAIFFLYPEQKEKVFDNFKNSLAPFGLEQYIRPIPLKVDENETYNIKREHHKLLERALKYNYQKVLLLDYQFPSSTDQLEQLFQALIQLAQKGNNWQKLSITEQADGLETFLESGDEFIFKPIPEEVKCTAYNLSSMESKGQQFETFYLAQQPYNFEGYLPKVSCICITYGRTAPLDEAVFSFLIQDYPGEKELIILSDYDQLELVGDFPGVHIYNEKKRYANLGEKMNEAIRKSSGEVLLVWDDDDINLPNRISHSVENLKNKAFYRAGKWGLYAKDGFVSLDAGHACASFKKTLWEEIGGYDQMNAGYDQVFEKDVKNLGHLYIENEISMENIHFIYRWGNTGSYHTSWYGYGKGQDEAERYTQSQKIEGVYEIKPEWRENYLIKKDLLRFL